MVEATREIERTRYGSPRLHWLGTLFVLIEFLIPVEGVGQAQRGMKRAWADSLYSSFENLDKFDASGSLPYLDSALHIFSEYKDTCRMARVNSWRSSCFERIGQLDSAVQVAEQGRKWLSSSCDSLSLMSLNVSLTNALLSLGQFERVLEICNESISRWNDQWAYSVARNGLYTNRAISMASVGDLRGSLLAFNEVLDLAVKEGNKQNEVDAYSNIGAVFGYLSEGGRFPAFLDSSEVYHLRALEVYRAMSDLNGVQNQLYNIAVLARDRGRYHRALAYLDSSAVLASELKRLEKMVMIEDVKRSAFFSLGMLDSAYYHLNLHIVLKDSLLNIEKVKAIADVQEKYESEKKAKEIAPAVPAYGRRDHPARCGLSLWGK